MRLNIIIPFILDCYARLEALNVIASESADARNIKSRYVAYKFLFLFLISDD